MGKCTITGMLAALNLNTYAMTKYTQKTPPQKPTDKKNLPTKHQTEELGSDYWDRIAKDVASGYESNKDVDDVLNTDQEADDHIRGDAAK